MNKSIQARTKGVKTDDVDILIFQLISFKKLSWSLLKFLYTKCLYSSNIFSFCRLLASLTKCFFLQRFPQFRFPFTLNSILHKLLELWSKIINALPDSPLIFPSHHSQSLCSSFSKIYETLDKLRESTDDFLYLKFKLNIDGGLTYLT